MQLDGYSELTKFAQGGMATVYKGRQISLSRTVAIKLLSAECLWDNEAKALFDQESLVIAQLNHPNIIHIIDRGFTAKGRPYFVMEYIDGSDLSQLVGQQQLSTNTKLNLMMQTCKGLACAHNNGVIHRDIKPANLLIDAEEHVHVLDFGIAWLAASGRPEDVVGTPDYMSPEQFNAPDTVTAQSDIYSLGVVMYELFLGKLPAAAYRDLSASMAELPTPLAELIEQCLQTSISDRPETADDVRVRLLKILHGDHIQQGQKAEAENVMGGARDKFELLDVIKSNQYGAVYLFEDRSKQSLLVIKKRINSMSGYGEAKQLTKISHSNIINILGVSERGNTFIVVMEHLVDGSLQDRLIRPWRTEKFISIARQVCRAMSCAHEHNIAHLNLRPSNILFGSKNRIKITDFGLEEHYTVSMEEINWYQTEEKDVVSTVRDIYSAGAVFYRMLTGEHVRFDRGRILPDSRFSNLDENLCSLLRNMMEKGSSTHYQSFRQIIPDLNRIRSNLPSIKAKRRKKVILKIGISVFFFLVFNMVLLSVYFYFYPQKYSVFKDVFIQWGQWLVSVWQRIL